MEGRMKLSPWGILGARVAWQALAAGVDPLLALDELLDHAAQCDRWAEEARMEEARCRDRGNGVGVALWAREVG